MKKIILILLVVCPAMTRAQKIEAIFANLYTDSLKKGTYNYINIDGQLSNGRYLPLDSTDLVFWASAGKFSGNSLWIDKDFREEKVNIRVTLRKNPALFKEFVIYVKKNPDPALKTMDELIKEQQPKNRSKRNK